MQLPIQLMQICLIEERVSGVQTYIKNFSHGF